MRVLWKKKYLLAYKINTVLYGSFTGHILTFSQTRWGKKPIKGFEKTHKASEIRVELDKRAHVPFKIPTCVCGKRLESIKDLCRVIKYSAQFTLH